jgi:hypothetical protein
VLLSVSFSLALPTCTDVHYLPVELSPVTSSLRATPTSPGRKTALEG